MSLIQRMGVMVCLWTACASLAWGQGVDLANRPVAEVSIAGVGGQQAQLVRNQLVLEPGDPYSQAEVAQDIENLTRLGLFSAVRVQVEPNADGTVDVTYVVETQPLLTDVQVVGNKAVADQEIQERILLQPGDPRDPYLIQQARERIEDLYRGQGFFLVDVTADEQNLEESGALILKVREGPRVRVQAIEFEGNNEISDEELRSQLQTKTYVPVLRKGVLSEEQLEQDVAALRQYYQQRGFLDVRVGRRVELSEDQRDAVVTFFIEEGPRYTVEQIEVLGNQLFPEEQILQAMALREGDVFSADRVRASQQALQDLYGKLGFIETEILIERTFHGDEPKVDVLVTVDESQQYLTGNVLLRGNQLTQDKVVRRQLRGLNPGEPIDVTGIEVSRRRLRETGLFDQAEITVQGETDDPIRDVVVEVREASTGSMNIGAAVSSDSGIFGAFSVTQRNFDITDVPETWGEFLTGQAFRGAGQYFAITLQPGNEFQRYQVTFKEPYLLGSDFFLETDLAFFERDRDDYNERRFGGELGVGKRFGDIWSAAMTARGESVRISSIEDDSPVDVFDVEGSNFITGLGFNIRRSTVDSRWFPTRGTRAVLGIERAGALGGDFDFTKATSEFNAFFTVDEDFLGRKTTVSLRTELGYIIEDGEAPIFERFYAGGHRSFRGFEYRGVGPRGIRADTGTLGDDPVGGQWLFLLGMEYNYPIWADYVRGVFFVDSGTVQEDLGLDEYRVSLGGGLRLMLPFFGQAPFALDLAYPVVKEEGDETQVFSFDLALPF